MGRPPRNFTPDGIYFVTNRCADGRYLLTPNAEVNRIVSSAMARFASVHGVELFAWVFMGNHFHLVVRSQEMRIPDFMRDFQRHVSHEVTRLRDEWNTVMFPTRYSCEPILDDAALRDKIDYVHLNPVRAGLVRRPDRWPGVSSIDLYGAEQKVRQADFLFRDRLAELQRKSEDGTVDRRKAMESYPLEVTLPPAMEGDDPREARETCYEETLEYARQWAENNRLECGGFAGREAVRQQDPVGRPDEPPTDPEPLCHTTEPEKRDAYREHRRNLTNRYRSAMEKWRNGDSDVMFPPGTRPPGWNRTRSFADGETAASPSNFGGPPRGDPGADFAA